MEDFTDLVSGGGEKRATSYEDWIDRAASERAGQPHPSGDGWMLQCPAHPDNNPSLSVKKRDDGGVLFHCFAGCDNSDILRAFSKLSLAIPESNGKSAPVELTMEIEATWDYRDLEDHLIANVVKYRYSDGSKSFRQRRKGPSGEWVWNLGDIEVPIYNYANVRSAIERGETIYICEGEKDADAVIEQGEVATTNPMGVDNWKSHHTEQLSGAENIVVILDNDGPGLKKRPGMLTGELGDGIALVVPARRLKDAYDHFANGYGVADFTPYSRPLSKIVPLGDFMFGDIEELSPVWGLGEEMLWAKGEAMMIAGPTGHGKTTLAVMLLLHRTGALDSSEMLGLPIQPTSAKVLYLAMDRPTQIQRAMNRLVKAGLAWDQEKFNERGVVHRGPLVDNDFSDNTLFLRLADEYDADTIFIDSLKDLLYAVSDEEQANQLNSAFQMALAQGIEFVISHHTRKSQSNTNKPVEMKAIDEVYGNSMLTNSMGSVVGIFHDEEADETRLRLLKRPAEAIFPLACNVDQETGTIELKNGWNPLAWIRSQPNQEGAVSDAAAAMLPHLTPATVTRVDRKRAQRRLDALVPGGLLSITEEGGRGKSRTYRLNEDTT